MKKSLPTFILFFVAFGLSAQSSQWTIDKSHSKIQFDIAHMAVSEVSGQFSDYTASIVSEREDFTDASIQFSIQVNSIDTDDAKRDAHLLKPDFLDAEKFPSISFKSSSLKKQSDQHYLLIGDFTMHGISKTIQLDVIYRGTVVDPRGNTKAGFKVSGILKRTDFGLLHDSVLDSGGLLIGEDVNITCRLELVKSKS